MCMYGSLYRWRKTARRTPMLPPPDSQDKVRVGDIIKHEGSPVRVTAVGGPEWAPFVSGLDDAGETVFLVWDPRDGQWRGEKDTG